MKTEISHPIYQEAMGINRSIQRLTKGYHSNGTFNLAYKIKDNIIAICNDLDQGVAARFEHTFEQYYKSAIKETTLLLERIRIANAARMLKGGIPDELIERIKVLRMKIILMLELFQSNAPLDYLTLSSWAHQKVAQNEA